MRGSECELGVSRDRQGNVVVEIDHLFVLRHTLGVEIPADA